MRLRLQVPRSHFTRGLGRPGRCFLGVMWSGPNAREPSGPSGASWRPRVQKDAGNEWEPQEVHGQERNSVCTLDTNFPAGGTFCGQEDMTRMWVEAHTSLSVL